MKILVHTANANDACSFYRAIGPWSALSKKHPKDVHVTYGSDFCWGDVRSADILFMLRPTLESVKPIIQCAKDWGTKVWVDWDDDPFSVPTENPSFEFFSRPSVATTITESIEAADLVTVSTDHLAKALAKHHKCASYTIPNAFDDGLLRWRNPSKLFPNNYVLWRGTRTHERDIDSVADDLVEIHREFPMWKFIFLGADPLPFRVSERMHSDAVIRVKSESILIYFKIISAMRPRIMIAPLADIPFNRSKSCIASLEASFAGAACVGPNFPEWDIPGCIQYSADNSRGYPGFAGAIRDLMLVGDHSQTTAQKGFDYISGDRSLSRINEFRLDLALELIGEYN